MQERMIILEGHHSDTALERLGWEGESVSLYGEKSHDLFSGPAVEHGTGIEYGFEIDIQFIEHAFGSGLYPFFPGSDDTQVVPTRSVREFFPFGHHGDSFHHDTSVFFDTGGMGSLIEPLRREDFAGVVQDFPVMQCNGEFQVFAVSGSTGFDLRDRGDGEGDGEALGGIGFRFSVIDKAFHGFRGAGIWFSDRGSY